MAVAAAAALSRENKFLSTFDLFSGDNFLNRLESRAMNMKY